LSESTNWLKCLDHGTQYGTTGTRRAFPSAAELADARLLIDLVESPIATREIKTGGTVSNDLQSSRMNERGERSTLKSRARRRMNGETRSSQDAGMNASLINALDELTP
jgi:hypothetical protein